MEVKKKTPLYKSKSGHISREESTSSFDARLPGMWSSNTLHSPPPSTWSSFSSQLSESTVSVSGCGIVRVLAIGLANIYPWHQYCLITVHYRWHLWHLHLTCTCIQTCTHCIVLKNQKSMYLINWSGIQAAKCQTDSIGWETTISYHVQCRWSHLHAGIRRFPCPGLHQAPAVPDCM